MKMTAILNGLHIKNPSSYDNNPMIKGDILLLRDGTEILFDGEENGGLNDCFNYPDWSALEDTGFFEDDINAENLKLEETNDYGFRINGYFVPCYSSQNGYYTNELDIKAVKDGKTVAELTQVRGAVC